MMRKSMVAVVLCMVTLINVSPVTGLANTIGHMPDVVPADLHVGIINPNNWHSDKPYWNRASNKLYLSSTSGTFISTSQTEIWIDSSDSGLKKNYPVRWYVNSPDCKISQPMPNSDYVSFTATKPGIYSVQAQIHGVFSVPLVLTVDMSKLKRLPFSVPAQETGIVPFPKKGFTSSVSQVNSSSSDVTVAAYDPIGDWIPIAGRVHSHASNVAVFLTGWDYLLPVSKDGTFRAMLRYPYSGNTQVTIVPDYFDQSDSQSIATAYNVNVRPQHLTNQTIALLANAHSDFNMSRQFFDTASTLLENSPSIDTAIEAIDNYVSQSLTYNITEYEEQTYVEQDAVETMAEGTGMCMDFARTTMAYLQSVGIAAEVQEGTLASNIGIGAHIWLQAWDGGKWIPMDPSYTSLAYLGSNRFFTETLAMKKIYHAYFHDNVPIEWSGTAIP